VVVREGSERSPVSLELVGVPRDALLESALRSLSRYARAEGIHKSSVSLSPSVFRRCPSRRVMRLSRSVSTCSPLLMSSPPSAASLLSYLLSSWLLSRGPGAKKVGGCSMLWCSIIRAPPRRTFSPQRWRRRASRASRRRVGGAFMLRPRSQRGMDGSGRIRSNPARQCSRAGISALRVNLVNEVNLFQI
jgi:hypothetical protein